MLSFHRYAAGRLMSSILLTLLGGKKYRINSRFTSGTLPSGWTLTRASAGTYFNSSGIMQTASTDVARFDYNPVTLAPKGILVEPSKTNMVLQSAKPGTSPWWIVVNNAATLNNASAPDGTTSATKLTGTAATSLGLKQGVTFVNGTTYSVSAYLKAGSTNYGMLNAYDGVKDFGVMFNLASGAVVGNRTDGAVGTPSASGIISVGNGWYYCWFVFVSGGTGSPNSGAQVGGSTAGNLNFATSWTGTLYAWGYQHEAASAPTSYIDTTTATVTRAADVLSTTIPSGVSQLIYTFDDGSTQTVSVSPGAYTVPTNLNRARIKRIRSDV